MDPQGRFSRRPVIGLLLFRCEGGIAGGHHRQVVIPEADGILGMGMHCRFVAGVICLFGLILVGVGRFVIGESLLNGGKGTSLKS